MPKHVTNTVQIKSVILYEMCEHFKITPHKHIYDFILKNNTCSFASRACAIPTYTMPTVINVPLFSYLNVDFNTNALHVLITIYIYLEIGAASTLHIIYLACMQQNGLHVVCAQNEKEDIVIIW